MGDLMPYIPGMPERLPERRMRRQAELAKQAIEYEEAQAAYRADLRIGSGVYVGRRTANRLGDWRDEIAARWPDDPARQLDALDIHATVKQGAKYILADYMTRQ